MMLSLFSEETQSLGVKAHIIWALVIVQPMIPFLLLRAIGFEQWTTTRLNKQKGQVRHHTPH